MGKKMDKVWSGIEKGTKMAERTGRVIETVVEVGKFVLEVKGKNKKK